MATVPLQKAAIADGTMARPRTCSICGCGWTRENPVWLHDENYADPLAAYPVCRRCHRLLHERFDQPEPWLELVARCAGPDEPRWFEQLTLDPASMRRPFETSYPLGLPPP